MATINPDVYQKFRNVKKLPTRQLGDGNEIEVEVREDEEQSVKLQEIIDLLVAAGYFRARIKGLSAFDKIVGGMSWCIESCNVDLDVDLLFQENSTIGQRIALTEKIVAVLPKIKCPHRIEPHQIQGLDCVHIFPIIQWLVKRSMEFRQEISEFVRSFAVSQYNKQFALQSGQTEAQKQILSNVKAVRYVYRPRRFYRSKNPPPDDIEARVHIALLEYGFRGDLTCTNALHEPQIEHSSKGFDHLLSDMALMDEEADENFILTEEDKEKLVEHYASLQMELKDGGVKSREEKRISALEEQKQLILERCKRLEGDLSALERSIEVKQKVVDDFRLKELEAEKALKQLADEEREHSGNVMEVQELVMLNDNLKNQELQFREYCKQELKRLNDLIEDTKSAKQPDQTLTPSERKELEFETENVKQLRLQIAKRNRTIAVVQRKLDEIPSRAELAQYQRRFLELYNQVAAKHKETKQYYTLYNTLEDTKTYMKKELSLLNSICDSYPEAVFSPSNKEEFLKQFEVIVEGVQQSKTKVENRLKEEKNKRDGLGDALQKLIEQQRRYVAAVRQLSLECRRHEALFAQKRY